MMLDNQTRQLLSTESGQAGGREALSPGIRLEVAAATKKEREAR